MHLETFISEKYIDIHFGTKSVVPHENMNKIENFLIQSIVLSDIKIPRGTFWSPCADYSCHTCSFKFTQITGIYMTVGRIILLLLTFTGKYNFRWNNSLFVPVDNNIKLFDGFEDNFLEWQYCPCDRFSVIGTSTDYMYLFTINFWYKELVNLVYSESLLRI